MGGLPEGPRKRQRGDAHDRAGRLLRRFNAPEGSYRIVPGEGHDWLVDMTQEQLHLPIPKFVDDAVMLPPRAKSFAREAGEPTWTEAVPGVNRVGVGKAPLPALPRGRG